MITSEILNSWWDSIYPDARQGKKIQRRNAARFRALMSLAFQAVGHTERCENCGSIKLSLLELGKVE